MKKNTGLVIFSILVVFLCGCTNNEVSDIKTKKDKTFSKAKNDFSPPANPVQLGCYYYPEQWPTQDWNRDLGRMSELGFEFTHYGEFAWALLEPEEGMYDFGWLDKAIESAYKNKLKVVLCTPSAAPPVWLSEKYPEILMQNDEGKIMQHGSRQHGSWSSKVYQQYISKIVTVLAKKYGHDERIWGWQLDNEPSHYGVVYDYNNASLQAFRDWLKNKYQHIDTLNSCWGNNFWSQKYSTFDQIRIPNQKELVQPANPHALLDFQEFTNEQRGLFLRLQANILRENISEKQFITTNYMMQLPHIDPWVNQHDLDFASYTNYPINSFSEVEDGPLGFRLGSGRDLSFSHDFFQSVNGFTGIMELQPGQVNWGHYNAQPQPGAVRMWIWHTFALGAKFICTYRYRQPLSGNEQYHQGIMQTDGISLSRGGEEYIQAIGELNRIKKVYQPENATQARIGIWWDQRSMLDLYNFPHNHNWNATTDLYRYYESIKSFALPVEFITNNIFRLDSKKYPVVLVPSVQLIDTAMLNCWTKYVEQGGTLIITTRTGQKNRDGQWWKNKLQEKINPLTGAQILYYDHLPPEKKGHVVFADKTYEWNSWAEIIVPLKDSSGSKIVSCYSDQFFKGKAAVISNTIGKGKVIYIGVTTVDGSLEKEILKQAITEVKLPVIELPKNIYIEKRGNLNVAVNYSSRAFGLPMTEQQEILLGEKVLEPGEVTVWITR